MYVYHVMTHDIIDDLHGASAFDLHAHRGWACCTLPSLRVLPMRFPTAVLPDGWRKLR